MPQELAALAGSERAPEGAWSFDGTPDGTPERVTVTEEQRPQAGPEDVDGGGQADLAVGQAEAALRLGQSGGDRADDGDSSPSRTQTVPSPMTISQCQRDHGRRSKRCGMLVVMAWRSAVAMPWF
jgi:hypothetical protein